MPTGSNDSIITLGFDLVEETEQNAGIILGETAKAGAELTAAESPSAFEREQAELEEARAAAEEARQREQAEKQREQEQQQQQERSR